MHALDVFLSSTVILEKPSGTKCSLRASIGEDEILVEATKLSVCAGDALHWCLPDGETKTVVVARATFHDGLEGVARPYFVVKFRRTPAESPKEVRAEMNSIAQPEARDTARRVWRSLCWFSGFAYDKARSGQRIEK